MLYSIMTSNLSYFGDRGIVRCMNDKNHVQCKCIDVVQTYYTSVKLNLTNSIKYYISENVD